MKKNIRHRIFALLLLLGSNATILFVSYILRQTVVDSWKKGPLIDPAAPYSPENAQLFFAIGMCAILNIYFLFLAGFPKKRETSWFPFLALFLSIGLTELGVSEYLRHYQVTYFRPHPTLHWSCRANLKNFNNNTGGGTLNTNEFGMREVKEAQEKPEKQFRILVLGDSSNFGHGVEGNEMWSSKLQDILDPLSGLDVRVLNASCPGWTTWQALEVTRGYGGEYQPDLVIAGFNNDSGPDFQTERERVPSSATVRALNSILFRSELYVLSREAILSIARKLSSRSQKAYQMRLAGEKSKYGKLSEEETLTLKQRVPLTEMKDNLRELKQLTEDKKGEFIWVNMPINRREGEFVERYVDWTYRAEIEEMSQEESIHLIDIDQYWMRSREDGLHIDRHVFHPNALGHLRMAEQIASELLEKNLVPKTTKSVQIDSPPLAEDTEVLRLGFSSKTPIHSHLGMILQEHPELQEKYGLKLELRAYDSGKTQGRDVAEQRLDAWFSCAVPAVHMLGSRPDAKIIASVGELGRIAILGGESIDSFSALKNKRVGLVKGSTPDLYWKSKWFRELKKAKMVYLRTDELEEALETGAVDAIVSWDPWIAEWQGTHSEWTVLRESEFHSVLNVGTMWALGDTTTTPRAKRLVSLMTDAMTILRENQSYYDQKAAEMGDWSVETVEAVVAQNENIAGGKIDLSLTPHIKEELEVSIRFVHPSSQMKERFFGLYLLEGTFPYWKPDSPQHQMPPNKMKNGVKPRNGENR